MTSKRVRSRSAFAAVSSPKDAVVASWSAAASLSVAFDAVSTALAGSVRVIWSRSTFEAVDVPLDAVVVRM